MGAKVVIEGDVWKGIITKLDLCYGFIGVCWFRLIVNLKYSPMVVFIIIMPMDWRGLLYRILRERLMPMCQFHTSSEHDQFVEKVLTHRKLSRRLNELLRYRKSGLTTFSEIAPFEQLKIARQSPLKPVSPRKNCLCIWLELWELSRKLVLERRFPSDGLIK